MSAQANTPKRNQLFIIVLLIGISLFLCGASFFFWLSTGANTDKLPPAAREVMEKIAQTATEKLSPAPTDNSFDNNFSEEPSPTPSSLPDVSETPNEIQCELGFYFDPVLQVCIGSTQSQLFPTATPNASDSTQICSVGFIFDSTVNACVQVEIPTSEISNPTPLSIPGPESCSAGFTFDPVLNTCISVDVPTSIPTNIPGTDIDVDLPVATEKSIAIPTLPSLP